MAHVSSRVYTESFILFQEQEYYADDTTGTENISSNTLSNTSFYNPYNPKIVKYGLQTLRCIGPKIWKLVPRELREIKSLKLFTNMIKNGLLKIALADSANCLCHNWVSCEASKRLLTFMFITVLL